MFFYLSKLLFFLARPSNALVFLLVLGVVLLFTRFARLGRIVVTLAAVGLVLGGLSPLGHMLFLPLEERFAKPSPETLAALDGIVVLGGSFDTHVSEARTEIALNEAAERLTIVPELMRLAPRARIAFTGGSAHMVFASKSEGAIARELFESFGAAPQRILIEDQSRNTVENAVFTYDLAQPQPGERWGIVTSAFHMPRAMGTFRAAGWRDLVAVPVDYRTRGEGDVLRPFGSVGEGLRRLDIAVKEWIGLIAYAATGRSSSVLPAP